MKLRIMSFNVRGLRAYNKYIKNKFCLSFNDFAKDILKADILCIQETMAALHSISDFYHLTNYAMFAKENKTKTSTYGVATFVNKQLYCKSFKEVIAIGEGRSVLTDHGSFKVLNVYFPYFNELLNVKDVDLKKERVVQFYNDIFEYARNEENLIICGDFNATYKMKDHYLFYEEFKNIEKMNFESKLLKKEKVFYGTNELPYSFYDIDDLRNYFFETIQRKLMFQFIKDSVYNDTFRMFNKKPCEYSCWNTLLNLRPKNLGTRIDYVLTNKKFAVLNSGMLQHIEGSDHCPVFADVEVEVVTDENNILNRNKNMLNFLIKK